VSAPGPPALVGLVLAGGFGRRLGEDKGALELHGRPQAEHAFRLLAPFSASVRVSVRPDQADLAPYRDLPLVIDDPAVAGPAAGLLAAWKAFPNAALLVLAVDMPLVDAGLVAYLTARRDPAGVATAYRQPDGVIEPLCAIFEPRARAGLAAIAAGAGSASLRRYLGGAGVAVLEPPDPGRLASVNTPEALAAARASLAKSRI